MEGSLGGLVGLADRIDKLLAMALERAALSLMDVLDSGEYEVSGVYDKQEDVFKILQVLVIRLRVLLCPGTVQLLQWFIENDDPESALSEGWQDALFGAFTHESAGEPSLREPA